MCELVLHIVICHSRLRFLAFPFVHKSRDHQVGHQPVATTEYLLSLSHFLIVCQTVDLLVHVVVILTTILNCNISTAGYRRWY